MKTNNLFACAPRSLLRIAGGLGLVAIGGFTAQSLSAQPLLADLSIHLGIDTPPPPPRHEVRVVQPGPDYVWVDGYWDGSPGHYSWSSGHWERPPHAHARWVSPRWEKDHDGHYRMIRGGWH